MKRLIRFLKSLFFSCESWKDIERHPPSPPVSEQIEGWHIPEMDVINMEIALLNGPTTVSVLYISDTDSVEVQSAGGDDLWEFQLTITTRIFTKVNNVLEKHNIPTIDRELFDRWEDDLIEAQGTGKHTYHNKRYPVRRKK